MPIEIAASPSSTAKPKHLLARLRQLTESCWLHDRHAQMATCAVDRTALCETLDATRKARACHRVLPSHSPEDDSSATFRPRSALTCPAEVLRRPAHGPRRLLTTSS
jgi:hypothetical protein